MPTGNKSQQRSNSMASRWTGTGLHALCHQADGTNTKDCAVALPSAPAVGVHLQAEQRQLLPLARHAAPHLEPCLAQGGGGGGAAAAQARGGGRDLGNEGPGPALRALSRQRGIQGGGSTARRLGSCRCGCCSTGIRGLGSVWPLLRTQRRRVEEAWRAPWSAVLAALPNRRRHKADALGAAAAAVGALGLLALRVLQRRLWVMAAA